MQKKPLVRHPKLQKLSREHHQILVFALRLKKGLANNVDLKRLANYTKYILDGLIIPHMEEEENILLNLLPNTDKKKQILDDHNGFRAFSKTENFSTDSLTKLFEKLEQHIRFEERIYFESIQVKHFEIINQIKWSDYENLSCMTWNDPFWK
ncbi:MAG: hypothetical protein JJT77_13390 [Crocinitomicaceae bacterium]|nr:hypothetical protein [Crocinitomicaceae bacterium]